VDLSGWLAGLGIAVTVLLASWALLILLARRLPPGIARDLAGFLSGCVTTVWRLRTDRRVPRRAKAAIVFAGLWVASPIDLIPEFLPVIGPLDDVVVVALALRYAGRQVPRDVLLAAWPGDPRLLARLLGRPSRSGRVNPDGRTGSSRPASGPAGSESEVDGRSSRYRPPGPVASAHPPAPAGPLRRTCPEAGGSR
jgi:uncharacterized membrane protein YkvA (DUF1232 family)